MGDVEKLVQEEINKICQAFAVRAFTFFEVEKLTEKEDLFELAKTIQTSWIESSNLQIEKQHIHDERHILDESDIFNVFGSTSSNKLVSFPNYDQNIVPQEKSEACRWQVKIPKKEVPFELNSTVDETNIRFIENILSVSDEIKRKNPHLPTKFHEILFDEPEYVDQVSQSKLAVQENKEESSEDSGIFSENESGTSSIGRQNLPTTGILETGKTNLAVLNSFTSILENIKAEIYSNPNEVFQNWTDSLVEYNCSIACKCAEKGTECESIIQNFVTDLLNEIWSDGQMNHSKWFKQICVVRKLITTPSVCLEVLYFTCEVLNNVIGKRCTISLEFVKIAMFMDLCSFVASTLALLLKYSKSTPIHRSNKTVTELWQEKISCVESVTDCHQNIIQDIESNVIPIFSKFFSFTVNKEPLISVAVKTTMEKLKNLCIVPLSVSQDSLSDLY